MQEKMVPRLEMQAYPLGSPLGMLQCIWIHFAQGGHGHGHGLEQGQGCLRFSPRPIVRRV